MELNSGGKGMKQRISVRLKEVFDDANHYYRGYHFYHYSLMAFVGNQKNPTKSKVYGNEFNLSLEV